MDLSVDSLLALFPGEKTTLDLTLPLEQQGLDSVDIVEWIYAIEQHTGEFIDESAVLDNFTLPLGDLITSLTIRAQ